MLKIKINVLPGMRNKHSDARWRKYRNFLHLGIITKSQKKLGFVRKFPLLLNLLNS
jgi:hypothetical protein